MKFIKVIRLFPIHYSICQVTAMNKQKQMNNLTLESKKKTKEEYSVCKLLILMDKIVSFLASGKAKYLEGKIRNPSLKWSQIFSESHLDDLKPIQA